MVLCEPVWVDGSDDGCKKHKKYDWNLLDETDWLSGSAVTFLRLS